MKINEISISNVLGITQFELSPGKINVIEGHNAAGKSSVIKALMASLGGGKLSEIRNTDSDDAPEIVIRMEGDEGEGYILKKTATRTTLKKQVGDSAAYEDVKSPQRALDALFDGKMSNPISFLKADKKNRVNLMLEAIKLPYNFDEMMAQTGLSESEFEPVPDNLHPLSEIALHRSHIFTTRTGVNRDKKSKAETADQMLRSVPAQTPEVVDLEELSSDVTEKKLEIQKKENGILNSRENNYAKVKTLFDKSVSGVENEYESAKKEIESELELKISNLREEASGGIVELGKFKEKKLAEFQTVLDDCNSDISNVYDESMAELQDSQTVIVEQEKNLAAMQERHDSAIEIETIKSKARQFEAESVSLKKESDRLTGAIDAIDLYKSQLCEDLPVDGLELVDGEIFIDGVDWESVNTARQIEVAVSIAVLRSVDQRLPIIWIDGAEALDSKSMAELEKQLDRYNVQAIIGRVADHELTVKVEK